MLHLEEERGLKGKLSRLLTSFCSVGLRAETSYSAELACLWKYCLVCFRLELSFAWKLILVPRRWKIISTFSRLLVISATIISVCPDSIKEVLEAQACWQGRGCTWSVPPQLLFVGGQGVDCPSAMWGAFTQQSCLGKARLLSFLSPFTTAASAVVEMMIKCMRK